MGTSCLYLKTLLGHCLLHEAFPEPWKYGPGSFVSNMKTPFPSELALDRSTHSWRGSLFYIGRYRVLEKAHWPNIRQVVSKVLLLVLVFGGNNRASSQDFTVWMTLPERSPLWKKGGHENFWLRAGAVKVNDWGGVSSLKTSEVGESVFRKSRRAKTSFAEFTICSGPQRSCHLLQKVSLTMGTKLEALLRIEPLLRSNSSRTYSKRFYPVPNSSCIL